MLSFLNYVFFSKKYSKLEFTLFNYDFVYFFATVAPSQVNISVNPQVLKEGQRVNLTCESGSSNPSAKMTWWKDGLSIPSHSNYTLPGDNRGKRSVSVLMLDLTSELDKAVYTCSANNNAVKKNTHDAITLNVACKHLKINEMQIYS